MNIYSFLLAIILLLQVSNISNACDDNCKKCIKSTCTKCNDGYY